MNFRLSISSVVIIGLMLTFNKKQVLAQNGYGELDELYLEMVEVLKSSNDNRLRNFCNALIPDNHSAEFMKKIAYYYRGFPDQYEEKKLDRTEIVNKYFNLLYAFRERLKANNELSKLSYLGRKDKREQPISITFGLYGSEPKILLKSTGDNKSVYMGEMIKINGIWKSFTIPNLPQRLNG